MQRLVDPLVDEFVWYREAPTFASQPSTTDVPAHIAGHVCYGDSVVDEWFVVFLMQVITERFPGLVAQVWDQDGEFLLIEAACSLPDWLEPETSGNRIFLKDGCLHILPLEPGGEAHPQPLALLPALDRLLHQGQESRASEEVQRAIKGRTEGFPDKAKAEVHGAVCLLPAGLGRALEGRPQLASWAIGTLYHRDIDDMKAVDRASRYADHERVGHKIRFSRCRYAQLSHQKLQASGFFPLPSVGSRDYPAAERGMKLACGCMMLHRRLEEILRDDCPLNRRIAFHSEQDTHWQVLCRDLRPAAFDPDASEVLEQEDGKVRELFAKYRETEEYRRFLHHCEQACAVLSESTRAEHAMDDGLFGSRGELFDDDDGWLDSGEPTIRSTLDRLEKAQDSSRGSLHEVEDLAERMRDFFVGESTFQGAEVGGEFDSSTLDPDAFIAQMREALGFEGPSESDASDSEGSDVDRRRRHGNDPGSVGPTYREVSGDEVDSDDEEDAFYLAYDARLREELRLEGPSVRPRADQDASFAKDAQGKVSEEHEEEGSSPTRERDFDMSVVENFLASYAAQEGLPGPVSNFAGLFDIAVPGPEVDPSEDPT